MSAINISSASDEDVSFEGLLSRSVPCDMIDSTYSVLGSLILDEKELEKKVHKDREQPEEDDGVDVIDEESISENHGLQKSLQYLIGTDTGIHPQIYQRAEEEPSTTRMAESGDLGKSSSGSDVTAHKDRPLKIAAQGPLDFNMNLVFFILGTLLLAGFMQYRINYVFKGIQDDLEQERSNNELLSLKLESMNTQLQQLQRGGSATMSAYMKDQIAMQKDLCPVFVEILQIVEFFVHIEGHRDLIETCGRVIGTCLDYGGVQIKLFLESDGLRLLESLSDSSEWLMIMKRLFERMNEVHCTHQIVGHLFKFLDSSLSNRISMSQYASGILCKCLDDEDFWDANTEPTKHQVSEAVSKAIETWAGNVIVVLGYDDIESMVTWVKKSSATAQQHFAVWILVGLINWHNAGVDQHTGVWNLLNSETDKVPIHKRYIKNVIGEVVLNEILKDPRPHPHTKDLVEEILDSLE